MHLQIMSVFFRNCFWFWNAYLEYQLILNWHQLSNLSQEIFKRPFPKIPTNLMQVRGQDPTGPVPPHWILTGHFHCHQGYELHSPTVTWKGLACPLLSHVPNMLNHWLDWGGSSCLWSYLPLVQWEVPPLCLLAAWDSGRFSYIFWKKRES